MATKTFKIGLSTSDKSAMAQDVYERLIAMCFDEYDSTKTYNEGDFVVYENPADTFKLYKCLEDNVTGTWNSAKWELATFQDLVDDVEGAVASVDGKANVDGNYPTMTVGLADNLTPYDEESGDDQDEPFSFQATGTANGTQSDFATGSNALLREKQGHTLCVNQLAKGRSITNVGLTSSVNQDGSIDITGEYDGTSQYNVFSFTETIHLIANHKYLVFKNKTITENWGLAGFAGNSGSINIYIHSYANNFDSAVCLRNMTEGATISISNLMVGCIDLTQMFNGDIPQDLLDHPENFPLYYNGDLSYNTGTLVNANSQYIKCIGRNQWDEEWELGLYNSSDGSTFNSDSYIRSKSTNWIKVLPNTSYYFKSSKTLRIFFYDGNYNFISYIDRLNNTYTTPTNCEYIRFCVYDNTYGTTYNHDITISLYYSGESGYDQYYPYEVLTNTDTGTETLRQAGSVKDYKTPDGVIHRLVGTYTFTGEETWGGITSDRYTCGAIKDLVKKPLDSEKANIIVTNLVVSSKNGVAGSNGLIAIDANGYIYIHDTTNVTSTATAASYMSGKTIYYELAEPTEEQGTTFSPNLVIDDFGSMEFAGTSGVPQGNLIFYPVDYKAFVDTLYDYTEGTPSNIVLQSERTSDKSAQSTVNTQLQNAIGGTLRQLLASSQSIDFLNTDFVDLGNLNWGYNSTYLFFFADVSGIATSGSSILCSLYKTIASGVSFGGNNMLIKLNGSGGIQLTNSSYTDATAFKSAMKGVLLAYEKA